MESKAAHSVEVLPNKLRIVGASLRAATKSGVELNRQTEVELYGVSMRLSVRVSRSRLLSSSRFEALERSWNQSRTAHCLTNSSPWPAISSLNLRRAILARVVETAAKS